MYRFLSALRILIIVHKLLHLTVLTIPGTQKKLSKCKGLYYLP